LRPCALDIAEHGRLSDIFEFHEGSSALLVSIPHDGRELPPGMRATMTAAARALPDTDWHVIRLYDFARDMGASVISARFSRYVVDLNRPPDDGTLYEGQDGTGLCPLRTFAGDAIYADEPSIDVASRVHRYWRPYHRKIEETLRRLRARHGLALLWDAHSIASRVPMLFDGELPVLNIGTFDGQSCSAGRLAAVVEAAQASPYSAAVNARFKGGYVTRHYGDPENGVDAMQLELAQRAYMDEAGGRFDTAGASRLRETLRVMLTAFTMQR
jgi:N-formylglutamate deformylase